MASSEIDTPHGPARAHLQRAKDARGLLVLGHGAGGGVEAPDLLAVARAAREARFAVALVEQPYRVAGRRSAAPAAHLDAAFTAVCAWLRRGVLGRVPLVTGGRSSGARVACRTADAVGADGVLCLAFPLEPPRGGPSRLGELDAVSVPTLVIQGQRDAFGMPPPSRTRAVVRVAADHGLKSDLAAVAAAAHDWLAAL